jgi:hypothetical protein
MRSGAYPCKPSLLSKYAREFEFVGRHPRGEKLVFDDPLRTIGDNFFARRSEHVRHPVRFPNGEPAPSSYSRPFKLSPPLTTTMRVVCCNVLTHSSLVSDS